MKMKTPRLVTNALIGVYLTSLSIVSAAGTDDQSEPVMVNVDNFVRAETADQFDTSLKMTGGPSTSSSTSESRRQSTSKTSSA